MLVGVAFVPCLSFFIYLFISPEFLSFSAAQATDSIPCIQERTDFCYCCGLEVTPDYPHYEVMNPTVNHFPDGVYNDCRVVLEGFSVAIASKPSARRRNNTIARHRQRTENGAGGAGAGGGAAGGRAGAAPPRRRGSVTATTNNGNAATAQARRNTHHGGAMEERVRRNSNSISQVVPVDFDDIEEGDGGRSRARARSDATLLAVPEAEGPSIEIGGIERHRRTHHQRYRVESERHARNGGRNGQRTPINLRRNSVR